MEPLATIATALGSIKTAVDIAQHLRKANNALADAEYKLQLADMLSALAETKMQLTDTKEEIQRLYDTIEELKQFEVAAQNMIADRECYYEKGEDSLPIGRPYCSHCFETQKRAVHIVKTANRRISICPLCKTNYSNARTISRTENGEIFRA